MVPCPVQASALGLILSAIATVEPQECVHDVNKLVWPVTDKLHKLQGDLLFRACREPSATLFVTVYKQAQGSIVHVAYLRVFSDNSIIMHAANQDPKMCASLLKTPKLLCATEIRAKTLKDLVLGLMRKYYPHGLR